MKKLAIFASGTGTNAAKIIEHFKGSNLAKVALVVCNKPGAGVLLIAEKNQIPTLLIEKDHFNNVGCYLAELAAFEIDFIVLAGFLWKMPDSIVHAYPKAIINIHPALLPKYGGKGMYGSKVHEAVIAAGDAETGITIHYVNEQYDEGAIIFQATCTIEEGDDAATLATKVHALEHAHFARVVEGLIKSES
jgi:phosphoribosylglycinamide formyltransferase-1